jgi:hypothetical protein
MQVTVTIDRKVFDGDRWIVNASYEDENGGRSGQLIIDLPEAATDAQIKQAVISAYAA